MEIAARLNANLTQAELAKRFGAHAPVVSEYETGGCRIDMVELSACCRSFGVMVSAIPAEAGIE